MSNEERFDELMDEASSMPESREKVEVLEQAIQIADEMQDVRAGMMSRSELIQAASFSGVDDKATVAFAWCSSHLDHAEFEGREYVRHDVLWKAKWVIEKVYGFPNVPWEKCEALVEDIENRYKQYGHSLRPIHSERMSAEVMRGNFEQALQHRRQQRRH